MTEKRLNFGTTSDDMVRLLVCIATAKWGWTDEQLSFMKQVRKELFKEYEND